VGTRRTPGTKDGKQKGITENFKKKDTQKAFSQPIDTDTVNGRLKDVAGNDKYIYQGGPPHLPLLY
jgi:hypothetical protein